MFFVTRSASKASPGHAPEDLGHAELHVHLAARPRTLGELVDFANHLPADQITSAVLAVFHSVEADYERHTRPRARMRRLVILGALINRLLFEQEGIPKDRAHRL